MVRNYEEGFPVPADQIDRIVETARRAPSAGFTQGQSFVIVTDKATRSELAEILDEPSYRKRGLEPWISRAPVHVVICTSPEAYGERYGEPDKAGTAGAAGRWPVPWWIWDAGAAFMLLLLAAVDEGLAAGFLAFDEEARQPVRELLSIPEEVLPVGVVTIGKPAPDRRSPSLKRGWKPKAQVIHRERWNSPLS
jgi:nitroreductase